MRQRSIMIISAAIQALANEVAHALNPEGGDNFTVGLLASASPDDKAIPDFYVANWQFENNGRARFEAGCRAKGIWAQVKAHDLDTPDPAIAKPTFEEAKTAAGAKNMRDKLSLE